MGDKPQAKKQFSLLRKTDGEVEVFLMKSQVNKKVNRAAASVLLCVLAAATLFVQNISEGAVVFDFDGVPNGGVAANIEAYMEGIYGSDLTVVGGRAENDSSESDHYIQAGPSVEPYWVSFSFNNVNARITAVSFDWAVENNSFHAYADDVEIFSGQWDHWNWGNSGTISFQSPVTTLKFSDSGVGNIGVDNLTVVSVPEPTVFGIFSVGGWLIIRRRAKVKNNG